ncbi:3-deoxy-D-manno-octulosonic acid transferase [Rosettibacter firmus]|uniref:3-deoxy-D-manno-octulosonic acid transferase n=1 Tax=Rosettibacter firmus TaxID=3111522 RepID=UPI00336BBBF6
MKLFWHLLYNIIFYPALYLIILISPLLNEKIKSSIRDRKYLFPRLIQSLAKIDRSKKLIWFHSSSMGEFEQAKPIIEKIKSEKDVNIVVSFFSPSGYRNSLNYPHADIITYLPFDKLSLTKKFLDILKPSIAIFMRYDIWPNMIWQLEQKNIPYFIVDATMRSNSKRTLPIIKNFHKQLYQSAAKILTVSENDAKNFLSFGINKNIVKAVGDTRYDRVYQKSLQAKEKNLFKEEIFKNKKVLILGSTWESDEEVLFPAINKLLKYNKDIIVIIVPHEPTEIHLEKIENYFSEKQRTIRFSLMNNYNDENIIIVDSIGILLTLYKYADVAYVGGSFKQIHNVLEPAVYGIPVIYGPKYENSQEAIKLKEIGGGIVIQNKKEAYKTLRKLFSDESYRKSIGLICINYVKNNIGATESIIKEIYSHL